MAQVSLTELKARFQSKDKPSQKDFEDLIDSLGSSDTVGYGAKFQHLATDATGNAWAWVDNDAILTKITQTGHGLISGAAVYVDGSGNFIAANASALATARVIGFVQAVISANEFTLALIGSKISISGTNLVSGSVTAGTTYYLSTTAGKLTVTPPSNPNYVMPLAVGLTSGTALTIWAEPVPGITGSQQTHVVGLHIRPVDVYTAGVANNPTSVLIKCDEALVKSTAGLELIVKDFDVTINTTSVGSVNGTDTGSLSTGTYYLWLLYNTSGGGKAGVVSASSSAPANVFGYTHKLLVGQLAFDNTGKVMTVTEYGSRWRTVSKAFDISIDDNAGGLLLDIAHQLGVVPKADWYLVNKVAELGYAIGNEIPYKDMVGSSNNPLLFQVATSTAVKLLLRAVDTNPQVFKISGSPYDTQSVVETDPPNNYWCARMYAER